MDIPKYKIEELRQMDPEDALEEIERLRAEFVARRKAYNRSYYHENAERLRQYNREWRAAMDPKHRKDLGKARWQREKNKEGVAEKRRERQARRRRELGLDKNRVRDKAQLREADRRRRQRDKAQRLAREKPAELLAQAKPYLPGYLSPSARCDILNSVIELALARKVLYEELSMVVKQCVTAYNRQFDYFKNVSIDAPIAGTDGLTRADTLSNETPHF